MISNADIYAPDVDGSPYGGLPRYDLPRYGSQRYSLFRETWAGYGDGFVSDLAAAKWNTMDAAGAGVKVFSSANLIRHGAPSAGLATCVCRTVSPNIDWLRFHALFAESISIPRDACGVYLGMETTDNSLIPGAVRAQFVRNGANIDVKFFGPTVGLVALGSIAGTTAVNCGISIYPPSGATRIVRVFANGRQIGTDQTPTIGTTTVTNRNVSVYFNVDANVDDACRCGMVSCWGVKL